MEHFHFRYHLSLLHFSVKEFKIFRQRIQDPRFSFSASRVMSRPHRYVQARPTLPRRAWSCRRSPQTRPHRAWWLRAYVRFTTGLSLGFKIRIQRT